MQEAEADQTSTGRQAWVTVAMLFLFMLINFADKAVLGLSAAPIMEELHLTHLQFGQVASSFFLLFSLAAVLVGFVVNRVSTKSVLLIMALVWSVAQVPMLFLAGLPLLMANRILLGAGEGPAYPVALHAAYKWFPNERRPFPSSLISLGGAVGTGLVAPLIAYIIATWSWHAAFGVLGAASLVWALAWAAIGREGTLAPAADHGGATALAPAHIPYSRLLTCRTVIGSMALGFAAYWLLTLAVVWLPNYLNRSAGYSPAATSWIVTLPALLQIVAVPGICAFSQVLKRRGVSSRAARGLLTSSCVLVSGALTFLLPLTSGGLPTILCVMVAFSVGSTVFSLGHVMVAEVTPPAQRGAMLGINNAVATLAGVAAPLVMGWVIDLSANAVDGFRMAFMVAGAVVAVGSVFGALVIDPEADMARFARQDGLDLPAIRPALGV